MLLIQKEENENGFRNMERQDARDTNWLGNDWIEVPEHLWDKAMSSGGYCELVIGEQTIERNIPGEFYEAPIRNEKGSVVRSETAFKPRTVTETVTVLTDIIPTQPPVNVEALRVSKLAEISAACRTTITAGCNVTFQDGRTEYFSLEENDQINLTTAAVAVAQSAAGYLYHADGQLCRIYPAEEILAIATAATIHKTYHTTYCNHLNVWIRRAETVEELQEITYGAQLPDDLAESMAALVSGVTG